MPHGHPDWGEGGIVSTIFKVMDLGELAVRLGSPDSFHRGGNVIFLEGFEDGLSRWSAASSGTGAGVTLAVNATRNGAYSAKLTPGNAVGDYALIKHNQAYFPLGKLGVEFSFVWPGNIRYLYLTFWVYTGTTRYEAVLRYDLPAGTIAYKNSGGTYTDLVAGIDLEASSNLFHTLKLISDFTTGEFVRCILDAVTYSMTGLSLYSTADATAPYCYIEIQVTRQVTAIQAVYIDDVILTQNED